MLMIALELALTFQIITCCLEQCAINMKNDEEEYLAALNQDHIFIAVKTTKSYGETRLPIIAKTWFPLAMNQTMFFTDNDSYQKVISTEFIVNTKCPPLHDIAGLCCKTAKEFDFFIKSDKKWFCHFDDDNYVNVQILLEVLQYYDYQKDWFLGRREEVFRDLRTRKNGLYFEKFDFAPFGAGMCMSRGLALKLTPFMSGDTFSEICELIDYHDDSTLGHIVSVILKKQVTHVPEFNSHTESMSEIPLEMLRDMVSVSYKMPDNVVDVPGYSDKEDPTRFLSLHCFLYPNTKYCRKYVQ